MGDKDVHAGDTEHLRLFTRHLLRDVQALEQMLDLMHELHGLDRKEALALASLVVDLRITQVVNGTRGVHAVLPHGVLDR